MKNPKQIISLLKRRYIEIAVSSLLLLCLYTIMSVGVDLFPLFGISWTKEFAVRFNNVLLNLSYSYVAALIFYIFINYLPELVQKRKFQPFIRRDIKKIHRHYFELLNAMSRKCKNVQYTVLPSCDDFENIFECVNPQEMYPVTRGLITHATYLQTFLYAKVETEAIIKHIHLFKRQTPVEIISLLEELMSSGLFGDVVFWNSVKGLLNRDMKVFADSFYKGYHILEKLNNEADKLYS